MSGRRLALVVVPAGGALLGLTFVGTFWATVAGALLGLAVVILERWP